MLKDPCKDYGFMIQLIREGKGMSQDELAMRTGTTRKFIQDTECSRVFPSDGFIAALASALDVSFIELKERIWCDEPEKCVIW
ncbi:helix-turn-helix transcriptional regulator [Bacillus sp. ISL-55]|uniref:helix-turn-helix domain-containing protein n=1 Tax=Bacillus sp. ISL-55 TaxID=2819134 RepID=UPI001BEBD0C1|nr:helix-turn-helix transcriptional regulator [Bacillus sp. ISL-55]MBT2692636.1 helix-turn-helix transcriptional regulator [Bacillus sp. ISL-55]